MISVLAIFLLFLFFYSIVHQVFLYPKLAKKYPFKEKKDLFGEEFWTLDYRYFYSLYVLDTSHPAYHDFDEDKFDALLRFKHRINYFSGYTSFCLSFILMGLDGTELRFDIEVYLLLTSIYITYMYIIYNNTKKRLEH